MNERIRTASIASTTRTGTGAREIDDEARRVLRNTWNLLALTLLFAAGTAFFAMSVGFQYPGMLVFLAGAIGLSMLTNALRNSAWGILSMFAFTGFMGAMVGAILNYYLARFGNGHELVISAAATTGIAFLGMSVFAVVTKRDFSFMGPFLFAGLTVAFVSMLIAYFFELSSLALVVASMFALLSTGVILWQTQRIVQGGERNYIVAALILFQSIYNIFVSLLHLFGFAFGEE